MRIGHHPRLSAAGGGHISGEPSGFSDVALLHEYFIGLHHIYLLPPGSVSRDFKNYLRVFDAECIFFV